MRNLVLAAAAFVLPLAPLGAAPGAPPVRSTTVDPLDAPAVPTRLATSTQLSGIGLAGKRMVAVGIRGLVITSDDDGATWVQRPAPVSSDLLAVHFPTPAHGWVVGHDGVVLHSADGGASWTKQLDGRQTAAMLKAHFGKLAAGGDATAGRLLEETKLSYESGPEQALLDVWFEDARRGFVVGSFGTLLGTTDGGKTWQSWVEKVDSEEALHLNAIRAVGGQLYVASERGIVFRLDRARERFIATNTGYTGSFFTLAAAGDAVLAGGLRGTLYRSGDAGASWQKVESGQAASVTGAAVTSGRRVVLVGQNGSLLLSENGGASFAVRRVPRPAVLSGVVERAGRVVVVGFNGVQQVPLK